jgi:hypothetical protein
LAAPVLDGDERPRQIGRKLLDRHVGAAHLAAHGERPAVEADDFDRRRALGNFERLNRRQRRDDEGDGTHRRDQRPQAEHQRPIDEAPQR